MFGDFSSLMELYAVFNFAYIGTNEFPKVLETKIYNSKKVLQKQIEDHELQFDFFLERLEKLKGENFSIVDDDGEQRTQQDLYDSCVKELSVHKKDFINQEVKIKSEIERSHSIKNFSRISLLAAGISILFLGLSGFEGVEILDGVLNNLIFLICCIQLIITSSFWVGDLVDKQEQSTVSIKWILVFILCIYLCSYLFCRYGWVLFSVKDAWIISLYLVVPCIHFIMYLSSYFLKHYWLQKDLSAIISVSNTNMSKVSNLISNYDNFKEGVLNYEVKSIDHS